MRNTILPSILGGLLLSVAAASPTLADADSIKFNVTGPSELGGKAISGVIVGNMADPGTCQGHKYTPPAGSSWTWKNNGTNVEPFSLLFNFKWGGVDQTALKCVDIDPAVMSGNVSVDVTLDRCNVDGDPNNPTLRVVSATGGTGVRVHDIGNATKVCN